ncbi:MAG: hypothetical protein ACE5HE_10400, partial [Phycisphaerae bacterium]
GATVPVDLNNETIAPESFKAFYTSDDGTVHLPPGQVSLSGSDVVAVAGLIFKETDSVRLIRKVGLDDVVVDEINLRDPNNKFPTDLLPVGKWDPDPPVQRSCERVGTGGIAWTVPVPIDFTDDNAYPRDGNGDSKASFGVSFGRIAVAPGKEFPPVELLLADTQAGRCAGGSICSVDLQDCADGSTCAPDNNLVSLHHSFPTTGSLLLLMRHANSTTTPFTARLADDSVNVNEYIPTNPVQSRIINGTASTRFQIDNGRMPVFDVGYLHHLQPAIKDPSADIPLAPEDPDPRLTQPLPGNPNKPGDPGGVRNLPWGQLVFDYFTALPLSSPGPYAAGGNPDTPRVDQGGLRVHGRININAAPWPVLAGMPFISLRDIPAPFRLVFDNTLGLPGDPANLSDQSDPPLAVGIGETLAKAIVAYREARHVGVDTATDVPLTGNYGDTRFDDNGVEMPGWRGWRGWNMVQPKARRGTGFLTVGELANVRHDNDNFPVTATVSPLARFDSGEVEQGSVGSYLEAIAALATLADWVTVRSQVFTIYGVLRGEDDQTIENPDKQVQDRLRAADVDSRAIRFQETVDRLPMFLGERVPRRIGTRTVAKYSDFRDD